MVKILTIDSFDREFKRLAKKYISLRADLSKLLKALQKDPTEGTPMDNSAYKTRLAITSKNKGKSGGARVITCLVSLRYCKAPRASTQLDINITSAMG